MDDWHEPASDQPGKRDWRSHARLCGATPGDRCSYVPGSAVERPADGRSEGVRGGGRWRFAVRTAAGEERAR